MEDEAEYMSVDLKRTTGDRESGGECYCGLNHPQPRDRIQTRMTFGKEGWRKVSCD